MVDGDPRLQACHRWVVLAEPLLANLKSTRDRCLILKKRLQVAAPAEIDHPLPIPLDPICLSREDQGPLEVDPIRGTTGRWN